MINILPPKDPRPWVQRTAEGIRHPVTWVRSVAGDAPVYPLLVLFGLNAVDELDRTAFGILLPNIQEEFGLDLSGILTVVAAVLGVSLLLQIPIAHVADRANRVRLAMAGAILWTVFSFGTGLAATVWMLYVARIGSGLGRAVNDPTHQSLLADYYPIEQRARVYSVHRAANTVGQFLGPLLGGFLAAAFGWRFPFLLFGIPTIVLVVCALKMREPVRGAQERRAMGMSDEIVAIEEPPPSLEEAWRMVQSVGTLRRIFLALPFLAVSLIGFVTLGALKYADLGLDEAGRGLVAAFAEPWQFLGLYLGAKLGTKRLLTDPGSIMRLVGSVSFVAAAGACGFALAPNVPLAMASNVVINVALYLILPSVIAAVSLAIPARARSVGFSIFSLYVLPGLVAFPLIGWVGDNWGISWGMLMMTPIFVLAGLIISTASSTIGTDIRNVLTATAARSELLYDRRQGNIKLLLCRDLDVKYGDVQVLFGVDFEVTEGEVIALLGTNGAGKSTLLKAITGVVEASNGAVIFDGRDITHAPPHEVAALGVAMVPGGQGVFPSLSVSENLRVAGWLDNRRVRADEDTPAAVAARHAEVLEMFPILRDRLEDPAANLSGGQQQMLALGMAFLSKPKLLAIDELSLGLAPVVVEQLLPIVRRIADNGTTVILVEQSVNVALTLAETAVFMEKGEIRFRGPTAELLDRPDVLRSVFLEGASKGMGANGNGATPADGSRPTAASGNGSHGGNASAAAVIAAAGSDAGWSDDDARARDAGAVPDPDALPALEVVDLSVRFGGIRAVDSVSFTLGQGEILGVIGPNGAGKTTLFDLITGFTSADTGRVVIEGVDLTGMSADRRSWAGLGRSFQDAKLFPALTVEETIAVAFERWLRVKDPINAALRMPAFISSEHDVATAVDELIELMGIESFRTKFVHELSTGSRRVVDLACVVAHHPAVVLLDEPSSGIAQRETEALGPLIERIRDTLQASIIVIEHDMPLISSVSDRLLALDQGHVVMIDTPAEVLSNPEVVASYLGNTEDVINRSGTRVTS